MVQMSVEKLTFTQKDFIIIYFIIIVIICFFNLLKIIEFPSTINF